MTAPDSSARGKSPLAAALPWLVLAVGVAALSAIAWSNVPGRSEGYGRDYGLHFPNMLAGYFHFLVNGPFSVPWFTPAQCGGLPYLADLNVAYYAVPQWASFVVGPVAAVRFTFVAFAAAGAAGMYLLARSRFGLSVPAALAAALLFVFNGMFLHRMAVGHLTFHPFMLTPWLAWLVLPAAGDLGPWRWPRLVAAAIGVAAIFAYGLQAGMVHLLVPVAVATAAIAVIHGYLRGAALRPWLLLLAGGLLSIALSAQRVVAALAFGSFFPRDLYPLPGFANPFEAMWIVVESLFWRAPGAAGNMALIHERWSLEPHEWVFGLGPVAAALLLAGLAVLVVRAVRRTDRAPGRAGRIAAFGVPLLLLLALPVAVNWYQPGWNALLKETPVIGSSVTLVRWFAVYIPLVALGCGLALDRVTARPDTRWGILGAAAAATVLWQALVEPVVPAGLYDGKPIVALWPSVRTADDIPPISQIAVSLDPDGKLVMPPGRNNAMAFGYSQLACYQPMFGYQLETFPAEPLQPGEILNRTGAGFNIKNPACYLFPSENNCRPGDHFQPDQVETVIAFATYHAIPFQRSAAQSLADTVNLVALAGTALLLAVAAVAALLMRREPVRH